jgi:hypothetical protein
MRSRTSRSLLHGTTTRTAPKQTVTFILGILRLRRPSDDTKWQKLLAMVTGERGNSLLLSNAFSRSVVGLISLLGYRQPEKQKSTQGNTTNYNRAPVEKKSSLNRKLQFFFNSCFGLPLKTRKFLLSHSRVSGYGLLCWSLSIISSERRKKNVEYYARPLREAQNRFFVYLLWIYLCFATSSPYILLITRLKSFTILCTSPRNFNR